MKMSLLSVCACELREKMVGNNEHVGPNHHRNTVIPKSSVPELIIPLPF